MRMRDISNPDEHETAGKIGGADGEDESINKKEGEQLTASNNDGASSSDNKKPINLCLNEWRRHMVITKEQEQMLADVKLINRFGLKDKFSAFLEHELKEKYGIVKEQLQEQLQNKKNEIQAELKIDGVWTEKEEAVLLQEQHDIVRDLIEKQEVPDKSTATEVAKGAAVVAATKLFDTMMTGEDDHQQSHELKEKYGIVKEQLQEQLQNKKNEIQAELKIDGVWTDKEEAVLLQQQKNIIRDLIEKQNVPDKSTATEVAKGAAVVAATKLFATMVTGDDNHQQSQDRNLKTRYADAFDKEGAEKYMKKATFLRWMLFFRRLATTMRETSFFCGFGYVTPLQIATVVYFLVAFYTFPVSWLIVNYFGDEDDADVFRPAGILLETIQQWELTDILLCFVLICLVTGFTVLVEFLAHISTLEVNGSLYNKHIEVFRPYVDDDKNQRTSDGSIINPSDAENPGKPKNKETKRSMLRESLWIKQHTNSEIERLLNASRRRHRWFFLLGYIGIGVFFIVGGFTYSYSTSLIKKDSYFVLDLILKISVSVIASLNGMATVIIIADHTSLMTAHFNGFEENLNLICLRALMLPKKMENGKVDKEEEILKGLLGNLKAYEDYLTTVAAASREVFEAGFDLIYFAIGSVYFFMLFYLYASFLKIINQGSLTGDGKEFTALACLAGTVVMTFPAAYPLYRMTEQSYAWKKFTDRLGSSIYVDAARLLSDDKEIIDFQAKFEKLQDHFTWKILGYPLSHTAITGAVTSYLAVLWGSIIYPAIQEYANKELDKLQDVVQDVQDAAQDLLGDL